LKDIDIPVWLEDHHGLTRENEPVTVGLPLPRGARVGTTGVRLQDATGDEVPFQAQVLSTWPDGSTKWLLLDFRARVGAFARTSVHLILDDRGPERLPEKPGLSLHEDDACLRLYNESATFRIPKRQWAPLGSAKLGDVELLSGPGSLLRLTDSRGREQVPVMESLRVETSGPLRTTVCAEGCFRARHRKKSPSLRIQARTTFFGGRNLVRIELQMRNPKAALHPGNLWDLGDPGSFLFKDLSLSVFPAADSQRVLWRSEVPGQEEMCEAASWTLYQDSSGGENWNCSNHLDRSGVLSVSFRGYRAWQSVGGRQERIREGERASPSARILCDHGWLGLATANFWQNFPKALRVREGTLSIGLFPAETGRLFELQGGEQKRHVLFLEFGLPQQASMLESAQCPIHAWVDADWIARTKAIPYFLPAKEDPNRKYLDYVESVIDGPHAFLKKREIIDEFGWRNFGDLYADHEAVGYSGAGPLISHYNNQYDFAYGALVQFLRSGDRRWWQLMAEAAQHTLDIDIYHTDDDRSVYNHGLFWHTDHYRDAGTCTHRSYSRVNGSGGSYGGGPSNEHNYTSGLLHYYFLTGDPAAADAVLELAYWVIAMDDGARTILGLVDEGPTGKASQTVDPSYHKPGRGAGNSINALFDAYSLSGNRHYFEKGESLIRRCIHPEDAVVDLNLNEPEYRWSYLVFLQVLGKYLDFKTELGEMDYGFFYARDSLLHYADWMAAHELPYKDVLHKVEIPTETWAAQDIRKCHVFHLAAKYGPPKKRESFSERASYFFERCLDDVLSFDTAYLTRPLVLLTVYGFVHGYFQRTDPNGPAYSVHAHSFGAPLEFTPQWARLRASLGRKGEVLWKEIGRIARGKWQGLTAGMRRKH
jgi:hypothetical protein